MNLETAAAICHRPFQGPSGPQDATLSLADHLIGAMRTCESAMEKRALTTNEAIAAAHAKGYGLAVRDLEGAACNLRAFSRGMIAAEVLPAYIAAARKALDEIEGALEGAIGAGL